MSFYLFLIFYLCPASFMFFIFNQGWLFFSNSKIEQLTRKCRNCYHKTKREKLLQWGWSKVKPARELKLAVMNGPGWRIVYNVSMDIAVLGGWQGRRQCQDSSGHRDAIGPIRDMIYWEGNVLPHKKGSGSDEWDRGLRKTSGDSLHSVKKS